MVRQVVRLQPRAAGLADVEGAGLAAAVVAAAAAAALLRLILLLLVVKAAAALAAAAAAAPAATRRDSDAVRPRVHSPGHLRITAGRERFGLLCVWERAAAATGTGGGGTRAPGRRVR